MALTPEQETLRTQLLRAARQGDETGDWSALKTLNANLSQPNREAIKEAIEGDLLDSLWPQLREFLT